jgi:hypothetical protein
VEQVLYVKLEVDPGTSIRDNTSRIEELPRYVALSIIMIEEHTWRAMKLRNDYTFSSVDHERSTLGHQRYLTEVNYVLFESREVTSTCLWVNVPENELDGYA